MNRVIFLLGICRASINDFKEDKKVSDICKLLLNKIYISIQNNEDCSKYLLELLKLNIQNKTTKQRIYKLIKEIRNVE